MNKEQYFQRSQKLKLPMRCPLVGKCMRWAETVYQDDTSDLHINPREVPDGALDYLIMEHRIDSEQAMSMAPIVNADREWPIIRQSREAAGERRIDETRISHVCPDHMLHSGFSLPGSSEPVAVRSAWIVEEKCRPGMSAGVQFMHYSECMEFIRHAWAKNPNAKPATRDSLPPKMRFKILRRDGFRCVYCGAKQSEDVTLHVDHRTSVKDGGKIEESNLVTACKDCNLGKGRASVDPSEIE